MKWSDVYLVLYNVGTFVAWLCGHLAMMAHLLRPSLLPRLAATQINFYYCVIQSVMLLDVLHNLLGIVKGSPFLSFLQVASRVLVVWVVVPRVQDWSPFHVALYTAWSTAECIRYAYYARRTGGGRAPHWLTWLRFSAFIVLYPVGVLLGELPLLWKLFTSLSRMSPAWWFCVACFAAYVPGFPVLYVHMLKQRRSALHPDGKMD